MDKSLAIKQIERKNLWITKWLAISHLVVVYSMLIGFILAQFVCSDCQWFTTKQITTLWPFLLLNALFLTFANYLCWKLIINCSRLEKLMAEKKPE